MGGLVELMKSRFERFESVGILEMVILNIGLYSSWYRKNEGKFWDPLVKRLMCHR